MSLAAIRAGHSGGNVRGSTQKRRSGIRIENEDADAAPSPRKRGGEATRSPIFRTPARAQQPLAWARKTASPMFMELADAPIRAHGAPKRKAECEPGESAFDEDEFEPITIDLGDKFEAMPDEDAQDDSHTGDEVHEDAGDDVKAHVRFDSTKEYEEKPTGKLTYAQACQWHTQLDRDDWPDGRDFQSQRLKGDITIKAAHYKDLDPVLRTVPIEDLVQIGPRLIFFQAAIDSIYKPESVEYQKIHTKVQRRHIKDIIMSCMETSSRDIAWYKTELSKANSSIQSLKTELAQAKKGSHRYHDGKRPHRVDTRHLPRNITEPDFSGLEIYTGSREQEIVEWLTVVNERMLTTLNSTKVYYLKSRLDAQLQTNLVAAFPDFHEVALKGDEEKGKALFDQVCNWLVTKYAQEDSLDRAVTKYENCKQKQGELIATFLSRLGIAHATAERLGMEAATAKSTARLLRGGRGEGCREGLYLKDILHQIQEDHPSEYRKMNLTSLTNAAKIAELKLREARSSQEGLNAIRAEARWEQEGEHPEDLDDHFSELDDDEEELAAYAPSRGVNASEVRKKNVTLKSLPKISDSSVYKARKSALNTKGELSAEHAKLFANDTIKHPITGDTVKYCAHCSQTGHDAGRCWKRKPKQHKNLNAIDSSKKKRATKAAKSKRKKK